MCVYTCVCSLPTSVGGLGCGNSALTSTVANTAPVYDSKDELSSLLQSELVCDDSLKKTKRCLPSLQQLSELSSPSPTSTPPSLLLVTQ